MFDYIIWMLNIDQVNAYKCNLYCDTLSVSDLEQAEICEKYNDPNTK